MPQLVEPGNLPPAPFNAGGGMFVNATIRQTVRITLDAPRIRLQISNIFGGTVLPITSATIALPANGAAGVGAIQTSTLKTLTFNGGRKSIDIPVGQLAFTDPIDFPVKAEQNVAISLFLKTGQSGSNISGHPGSRTTSWLQNGDFTRAENLTQGTTVHWYFISGIDGFVADTAKTLIILGDSITDGRGSDNDKNNRWPDLVLNKMRESGIKDIAIGNQAAGGNCILSMCLGPPLLDRYKRDALSQQGVQYVMIFEGVNDIGGAATDPATQQAIGDRLITAYQQITRDSRAKGFKVFAATITALGSTYTGGSREDQRQRINTWIRTNGTFDAVVDFDAILRNPDSPSQLQAQYDSGDGLHPNVAGYQAIADNFPLEIFGARTGPAVPAIPKWGQCGGLGFLGKGTCVAGTKCVVSVIGLLRWTAN
ncbi:hypothetical protein CVT24_012616 [Panaeolus cyanescens]|uniref:SGNH hydrolase-type esterase domain-containing protein n=1 Tax=Panaeolus cyanescens TaxID=181874 RepID=A0A409W657_9AGAR|nr:hypothetical protein CVT24_012616 [Panaeolus cyanescens]